MSDIQMSDAQMSAMAAVENQMTTSNTMDTSQSDVQANTVSVNDVGHGLAEAFGSQMSLEDADTHMSGATDNAVQASTANAGHVQRGVTEAFGTQAGPGDIQMSGATDNAVQASAVNAGDVQRSATEAFGIQAGPGDIQMSGATDSGIQTSAVNVSSVQQGIAEASDGDQDGDFSVSDIEKAIYEAFGVQESGEEVSNVQASTVEAGGIQESVAETSEIQQGAWETSDTQTSSTGESGIQTSATSASGVQQSAWEIDADDVRQSTQEVDGGDGTVKDAASESQPKEVKKNRSTRRQIKKREEKKREGVFSGEKSWKQVKAEKAERAAQLEGAAGFHGEVTGEASQSAGRGRGRGGRGGSLGGHAGHGALPAHLVAPPRIPESPRLGGGFMFQTTYYTPADASNSTSTSASASASAAPIVPAVLPATPPVLPATPSTPAAKQPSPSTPTRSDPLQLFPARTAKLPPVSLSPSVAPRVNVSYEDLLLEVQQYRHGLEDETDKNRKLRTSYATLFKKQAQTEKNLKSLQKRYDEVHDQNVEYQKAQIYLYKKRSEWTLETSASDPKDVVARLAEAIAKIESLELSLSMANEFAEDERELAREELQKAQGEFAGALTAEQEKNQQLKEEQSSASAEYNKAREDSSRISAELTESQRVWAAEYQALGERLTGEITSLQQKLVQTTSAFEENQRQLVAQRDGAQGQLIAEREQSRATFEDALAQLNAERQKIVYLRQEFDLSRAAHEESQRQFHAQQDKFCQNQDRWREEFEAQRVELEGRIQSNAEEFAQLKGRCNQLEEESAAMKSLADQKDKEHGLLKEQVAQLLDELRHTREDAEAEAAKKGAEVGELGEQLSQREAELEGLRTRELEWQASEESRGELKRDAEEQVRRLRTDLEGQIRALEEESDGQKELVAQMERELRERDAKLASSAIEKGTDDREKADLKRAVAKAEAVALRHEKTAANLKRELADAREEVNGAQSQLRDAGAIIQDLKRKVSSLERGAEKVPEPEEAASNATRPGQTVVSMPPLNTKVEGQEVELESAERVGSLAGNNVATLPRPADGDIDDKDLILSELLSSQDPFLREFRDKNGLGKATTTTAGHPDASAMSYSRLSGYLGLSDDDLVRRYSRNHPAVLFRSPEDERSFRKVVGQVREGRLDDKATIELDDLMAKQSPAIKQVYQISRISGGRGCGERTIIKKVFVEKPIYVEKEVYPEKPEETVIEDPVSTPETEDQESEQVPETAEIAVVERVGTTRWWRAIPMVYMLLMALCLLLFFGYSVFKSNQLNKDKPLLRPWERNLPYPWRFLMYVNGGVPPWWALYLRYWVVSVFDQGMPPY